MKLSEKKSGDFTPHEEGTFNAVCVDVTPCTLRQTQWGERNEFRLVFETDAPEREDGTRQCIWTRGFTPSLNPKSAFRKFLRSWRKRDITAAESEEFDTESLIGKCAFLVITHSESEDGEKTYANIASILPPKADLAPSGTFIRKKDRLSKDEEAHGSDDAAAGERAGYRAAAAPSKKVEKGEAVDATQAGADWMKVKVHVGSHKGIDLIDLDKESIEKLITNWIPICQKQAKQSADDKRLIAALKMAQKALAENEDAGSEEGDF